MYRVERSGSSASPIYRGVGGAVARAIDAVLSPIAPGLVLSRQRARGRSTALLSTYDAAKRDRTRRHHRAGSADRDLLADLPELRRNSRAMCRDDSSAAAMVKVLEDNVIGTGLRPQIVVDPQATGLTDKQADDWNRSCEQFFASWAADQADASEQDSFWDLQRQVLRSLVVDGEALLHRSYVDPSEQPWRQIGTTFELIDVDRIQSPAAFDPSIRAGVELGDRQQALAYWITPRHPDDLPRTFNNLPLVRNLPERWQRYAGGQPSIIHIFRRDRGGQTRGVPFFAPCFGLVEAMNDMLETELQASRAAAKFCAFIKQSVDANDQALEQQDDGRWYEKLETNTIRYLNKDEELQSYTPNRPGNNFEPFVMRVLRSICGALNLPYELVLKDFGGMNYSSARVALLEARRGFEVLQQMMVEKLCQPVLRCVLTDAVVSGELPTPPKFLDSPTRFMRAFWQPPAWGWVDPVKEIEASELAIEGHLSTRQAEAARQGSDAEVNLEINARFLKRVIETADRFGLSDYLDRLLPPMGVLPKSSGSQSTPQPDAPAEDAAPAQGSTK